MNQLNLTQTGSQFFLNDFPVLGLPDERRAVKYFSLNPFLPDAQNRCPLECVYCICHQDSQWHHHPEKFNNMSVAGDLTNLLLDRIFETTEGQKGLPISLCDYSDPFIPVHRERVLAIIDTLIERKAINMVYITTKVHPGRAYLQRLKAAFAKPNALRPTVFVSLPPLKPGYEEVSIAGRVRLLQDLTRLDIPCCWYLRPLVEEWFDETLMWTLARTLIPSVAHHVILSGIVMSEEIETSLAARNLIVPVWDRSQPGRKQNLSEAFELRLHQILDQVAEELNVKMGPVMGHRLCGINGNHAYGCLICAKQERYCQLFQLHHYGTTIKAEDNQKMKALLRQQEIAMRTQEAAARQTELKPSEEECS